MWIEPRWLHKNLILDTDLPDVVEHPSQFDFFDVPLRQTHLSSDRACDTGYAVSVAASKPVLRIDRLRERTNSPEKETTRLGVLRERIARQEKWNHEQKSCPKANS